MMKAFEVGYYEMMGLITREDIESPNFFRNISHMETLRLS